MREHSVDAKQQMKFEDVSLLLMWLMLNTCIFGLLSY